MATPECESSHDPHYPSSSKKLRRQSPSQAEDDTHTPLHELSDDGRHLTIVQYNCQMSWKRVISFLQNQAPKPAHEIYDILAFQEPFQVEPRKETEKPLDEIPCGVASYFDFIKGDQRPRDGATPRNTRVCFFINKRLLRAPWCGWSKFSCGSDIITLELPLHSKDGDMSSVLFIHNIYINHKKGETAAIDQLRQVLMKIENKKCRSWRSASHILLGDINIHSALWSEEGIRNGPKFDAFISVVERVNFQLLLPKGSVTRPATRGPGRGSRGSRGSTIDLIWATYPLSERVLYCYPCLDLDPTYKRSDHLPIKTILDLTTSRRLDRRNWKAMNRSEFLNSLQGKLPPTLGLLNTAEDIDKYARDILNAFVESIDISTPWSRPSYFSRTWWNEDYCTARKHAKKAQRQLQASRKTNNGSADMLVQSEFKMMRAKKNQLGRGLRSQLAKQTSQRAAESENQLQKVARGIEREKSTIGNRASILAQFGFSRREAAEAMEKQFYPRPCQIDLSDIEPNSDLGPSMLSKNLYENEVERSIDRCKTGINPGHGETPFEIIQCAKPVILGCLLHLFQASIEHGHCPAPFLEFQTYLARKSNHGNGSSLDAYRPIPLRKPLGKILESIVAGRISWIARDKNVAHPNYYRPRSQNSLGSAQHDLLSYLGSAQKNNLKASMLLIDATQPFLHISHARLINILRKERFPLSLINWIKTFLSGGRTSFLIDGRAEPLPAVQLESCLSGFGIPSGSSVSEALYHVYLSSLLGVTNRASSWSFIYEQTLAILSRSDSLEENRSTLSERYYEIEHWTRTCGRVFDLSTSRLIHFDTNTKLTSMPIAVDDRLIQPKKSVEFLGLTLNSRLALTAHVQSVERNMIKHLGPLNTIAREFNCRDRKYLDDTIEKVKSFSAIGPPSDWPITKSGGQSRQEKRITSSVERVRGRFDLVNHSHKNA